MRATDDGWDGERPWTVWPLPAAPLSLYMTVLSAMIRRGFVPLIIAYLGVTALSALIQTPTWLTQGINAFVLTNPGQYDWLLAVGATVSLLALPLSLAYGIFFTPVAISMQRIARLSVLAPDEIPTLGSAMGQLGRRYFPTLGFFVLTILLVIALLCFFIIPGIAAMIMLLAGAYLVVNGAPLTEGFIGSIRLVAANWLLVLIYMVVAIILGLVWFGCAMGLTLGAATQLGPWGQVAGSMVTALGGYIIGIPAFFFGAALLVTMEAGSYGIDVLVDPEMADLEG